ncbi:MAG TPA: A/G-specific adenine glycosylase [Candidatus Limnocylindrales bacterium]
MGVVVAVPSGSRDTNHDDGDAATIVPHELRDAVLSWYDARGRSLPFRATRDPYAILVSEAMAQQTQIARAAEKWVGFMAAFPTVSALAMASAADVLRAWRGLGYNRRAVNLRRAAQEIVARHGGHVPDDLAELERLPGIGPYTARAVAAIAFGHRVGPVDTNVRRVLARVAGRAMDPRELQALADAVVPAERPGDWTHAVMDVGATFCRPRPACEECPARPWCRFAAVAVPAQPSARRRAAPRFASTSRWLRGRILDRLRDEPVDGWTTFGDDIGEHDKPRIVGALRALAADGLLELDEGIVVRARLPTG